MKKRRRLLILVLTAALMVIFFWLSLPDTLFDAPVSTVVFDRNNELIGARIAADGQWRFPEDSLVPDKFRQCITTFEDRYFFRHPGVNLFSLLRALKQNLRAGKIVSGGSTLTMQTVRLSRKGKPRTVWEKLVEMWLALRLECSMSKIEILAKYASHAPFGGNVVGLDAAAWRYFGRNAQNLSWAETATLAVLPNAPSLIHPGKNRNLLLAKRNRLLNKLLQQGVIDSLTFTLSVAEPLPEKPLPLPDIAPHFTARMALQHPDKVLHSTLDAVLQRSVNDIVKRHAERLKANRIFNIAVMVLDMHTGEVLAYVGNTPGERTGKHGNDVDVIMRPRSSGSILKPLLYCAMLNDGQILPGTLVADIPTTINSYSPKNFNVTYDGAVHAEDALIRSLNIPAVRLLSDYGVRGFYDKLKACGFSTLTYGPGHYGLSLILGGAEVTLWDLCKVYHGLGNTLNHYAQTGRLPRVQFPAPLFIAGREQPESSKPAAFGAGAVFCTVEAMKAVRRPQAEAGWDSFLSARPVAWKTGTSFGFRDAWAVGVTPGYVVGVWAGNADGEGRPGLTGLSAAAPVMFEVFGLLPHSGWFATPWDDLTEIPVCRRSGMRASTVCPDIDTINVPVRGLQTAVCNYHRLVHLDSTERYRVNATCYAPRKMHTKPWFVLPPAMAWYYRSVNPFYRSLPPWMPGCNNNYENPMQLIRPDKPSRIFIPRQMDGNRGKVVFEAAHRSPGSTIYWYVDNNFKGTTQHLHKMALRPDTGKHLLTLMDDEGNILVESFEIVGK